MSIAERRKFLEAANRFVKSNDEDALEQVFESLSALLSEDAGEKLYVVVIKVDAEACPPKG